MSQFSFCGPITNDMANIYYIDGRDTPNIFIGNAITGIGAPGGGTGIQHTGIIIGE